MKFPKSFLYLFLAVSFCFSIADAQKTSSEPKNVLDFYLLLPAEYITPLDSVKNRQILIETKDIGNGYLTLKGKGEAQFWEGWAEIALFKRKSGGYYVCVVNGENATMHYSGIKFLEYKNSKWRDVTEEIFPKISDAMVLSKFKEKSPNNDEYDAENPPFVFYELPRQGTLVKMFADRTDGDPTSLYEFIWNGEKFVLKK